MSDQPYEEQALALVESWWPEMPRFDRDELMGLLRTFASEVAAQARREALEQAARAVDPWASPAQTRKAIRALSEAGRAEEAK